MCVACHFETDPAYPSLLFLGTDPDSCGDCHMEPEAVDVSWVENMEKDVRLTVTGENETAVARALALASEELRARGFRLVEKGEADLDLTLRLRLRTLRDDRCLPPGTPVRSAVLDARVAAPGETRPYVRRLGASKPEWGETEEEAVDRAVRDAWAVLSPHVLEALGSY